MEDIILLGLGGHTHSVVDSIEQTGKYNIIGFLDMKEMQGKKFKDYCVLDTDDALKKYFDQGIKNAFITIGFMGHGTVRNHLYKQLKDIGYTVPNIIDSTAVVSESAELEDGIFIGKNAVVNANVQIRRMCIINTGAILEHDCIIGEFSHIAVGSVLCGGVLVGEQTLIGANATVIQERKIGNCCIIGAGTIVSKDVQNNMIRYGTMEKQKDVGVFENG
ncbi:MAG: acetyltransferase [Roseburia sp.]|nr:acetyltransferase [Roseburia sp.]MCM1201662.1 acetyltransferase [Bacteroides fragilis]